MSVYLDYGSLLLFRRELLSLASLCLCLELIISTDAVSGAPFEQRVIAAILTHAFNPPQILFRKGTFSVSQEQTTLTRSTGILFPTSLALLRTPDTRG